MPIIFNGQRLKSIRLQRAWSQEQLAEISGVSPRTIQRLEQGSGASLETTRALSAAMEVSASALIEPPGCREGPQIDGLVRRITPLTVLPDIGQALRHYLALGFSPVETGDPACVGLQAGNTYLILMTAEFMAADFRQETVAPLVGLTILYIYVRSVGAAKERLPASARVVEQVLTRGGTIEALVNQGGQYLIFAEKTDGGARPRVSA